MNGLYRTLRMFLYVMLIVLASIGMAISGPVPISQIKKRENKEDETKELIEETKTRASTKTKSVIANSDF